MQCVKCGREIKEPNVFCPDCLKDMERYPVEPNVTVTIPVRPVKPASRKKKNRTRYTKPEDQIKHLKAVIRWLWMALIVLLIAFSLVSYLLLQYIDNPEPGGNIGQNYGSMTTDPT